MATRTKMIPAAQYPLLSILVMLGIATFSGACSSTEFNGGSGERSVKRSNPPSGTVQSSSHAEAGGSLPTPYGELPALPEIPDVEIPGSLYEETAENLGDEPTGEASEEPSGEPSENPSGEPTADPNAKPGEETTGESSQDPGEEPANEPVSTPVPSPTPPPPASQPDAKIDGGILTVNKSVSRIEVSVTLDHVTDLMIGPNSIFFVHRHLGFPGVTTFKLYGENGQLLNTMNYLPQFKVGYGKNCPNITNLKSPGECISLPISIPGHSLSGLLTKLQGRGYVGVKHVDGWIVVSAYDCGADCGSPGGSGKLSGVGQYTWIIQ